MDYFELAKDIARIHNQLLNVTRHQEFGEGKAACIECNGKGWVKCEHQEIGDHRECLDCGYDTTPDLADQDPPEDFQPTDTQLGIGGDR